MKILVSVLLKQCWSREDRVWLLTSIKIDLSASTNYWHIIWQLFCRENIYQCFEHSFLGFWVPGYSFEIKSKEFFMMQMSQKNNFIKFSLYLNYKYHLKTMATLIFDSVFWEIILQMDLKSNLIFSSTFLNSYLLNFKIVLLPWSDKIWQLCKVSALII